MIRVSKGDFQKFYWQIAQICFANATYEGNVDFLNDLSFQQFPNTMFGKGVSEPGMATIRRLRHFLNFVDQGI